MTDLHVTPYDLPARIDFNFEELKAEIEEKAKSYSLCVYTEDTVKLAKEDRATLNRLKKALNDERIRREKEYNAPFMEFKNKVNELIAIIDKPVGIIDAQVKSFEEAQRQAKADEIARWYTQNRASIGAPLWLELKRIAKPQWANASVKTAAIFEEIKATVAKINADIETINALPGFSYEAMTEYTRTLDLSAAIAEGQRQAEIQRRKKELEEARKAEEERRKAAEEERKAQEAAQNALKAAESAKTPEVEQIPTEAQKTAPEAAQRATEAKEATPAARWVAFEAYLTTEQAFALRDYFKNREILYRSPKKGE